MSLSVIADIAVVVALLLFTAMSALNMASSYRQTQAFGSMIKAFDSMRVAFDNSGRCPLEPLDKP